MLLQYIKSQHGRMRGQKRGVIIAVPDPDPNIKFKMGWSAVHSKKDIFDKDLGIKIALGRCNSQSKVQMPKDFEEPFNFMLGRAKRYFK